MVNAEHFRKLEHMYHNAPVNKVFKPSLKVFDRKAEISMEVDPQFFHAAQALHGSVYFKMLDDAAFFAASSVVEDVFVLTTGFNIHFFRPITQGIIRSVGKLKFSSKNLFVCDARLYADDRKVASGTGTFMRSRNPLNEKIGYKLK